MVSASAASERSSGLLKKRGTYGAWTAGVRGAAGHAKAAFSSDPRKPAAPAEAATILNNSRRERRFPRAADAIFASPRGLFFSRPLMGPESYHFVSLPVIRNSDQVRVARGRLNDRNICGGFGVEDMVQYMA